MKKKILVIFFMFVLLVMMIICNYKNFTIKNVDENKSIKKEKNVYTTSSKINEFNKITRNEEFFVDVWITANLNIRKYPDTNSEIIAVYPFGTKTKVTYINNDWAKVKNTEYYISRKFISESCIKYKDYDVPNNSIKSYMDYRKITLVSSKQYKLQKIAYTGDYGIRMVNERYCVAVGSYYTTKIGQYIDIELENGSVIHGILADCKADRHTDSTNRFHPDGSVVEFVVNTNFLNKKVKKIGDVSYINDWNSEVINIRVYDKVENF